MNGSNLENAEAPADQTTLESTENDPAGEGADREKTLPLNRQVDPLSNPREVAFD